MPLRTMNERNTPKNREELAQLWKEAFKDSDAFVRAWIERLLPFSRLTTSVRAGKTVSMMTEIPCALVLPDGSRTDAGCIYGFCTASRFRRRGIGRRLLSRAGHDINVLCPADAGLFGYYSRAVRAEAVFFAKCAEYENQSAQSAPADGELKKTDAAHYAAGRRALLEGHCYVDFGDETVAFQQTTAQLSGGDLYEYTGKGGSALMCASLTESGTLCVCELLARGEELAADALRALGSCFPAAKTAVRAPVFLSCPGGRTEPFAVMYSALGKKLPSLPAGAYFGLNLC